MNSKIQKACCKIALSKMGLMNWVICQLKGGPRGSWAVPFPIFLGNHFHANNSTFLCFQSPRGPLCGKQVHEIRCLGPVRYAWGWIQDQNLQVKAQNCPVVWRNRVWRCTNLYWNGNLGLTNVPEFKSRILATVASCVEVYIYCLYTYIVTVWSPRCMWPFDEDGRPTMVYSEMGRRRSISS